jgi:hypothetical protein
MARRRVGVVDVSQGPWESAAGAGERTPLFSDGVETREARRPETLRRRWAPRKLWEESPSHPRGRTPANVR